MTLRKADIARHLWEKGYSKKYSGALVDSLLEILKTRLAAADALIVSGFGKFYVRRRARRAMHNPRTGRTTMRDEGQSVRFRCSPVLRWKMNK